MATTIMFGLTFGTILTMVVVTALYITLNRLRQPDRGVEPEVGNEATGLPA